MAPPAHLGRSHRTISVHSLLVRHPTQLVFWSSMEPSRATLLHVLFLQHWRACDLKTRISDDMSTKKYNKTAHASRFTFTDAVFSTQGGRGCLFYLPQRAMSLALCAACPAQHCVILNQLPGGDSHRLGPCGPCEATLHLTLVRVRHVLKLRLAAVPQVPPHPQGEDDPARHDTRDSPSQTRSSSSQDGSTPSAKTGLKILSGPGPYRTPSLPPP